MNKERLLQRFLSYVTCSSETFHEKNFCLLVEDELRSMGIEFERQMIGGIFGSDGWNILAKLPGKGEPILFCAHLDTVCPGNNIKPVIKDGVIYSDGTTILGSDDKAGIAALLEAVQSIMEEKADHRPVEILFTLAEEEGMHGSKNAEYGNIKSKEAIVLDDETLGHVVCEAAANARLYFEFFGRAAHAGVCPEAGLNALKAAAKCAGKIEVGHISDISVANIANFRAPGATNIVPDYAAFDMEVRSYSADELEAIIAEVLNTVSAAASEHGVKWEYKRVKVSGAFALPADAPIKATISSAMKKNGVEPVFVKTLGGCDMTWLVENKIDAVNIGIGMTDAHTVSENIKFDDMVLTAKIIKDVICE